MHVDCPECGASLTGTPGAEMVCPACMTPFLVPAADRAIRTFDVQSGGEAILHGMSRHAIREAIYTGRLDATARVRHGGKSWELIGGYPEFAAVFRLLGGDLAPMAGTRKLAGWGRGGRRDVAEEPTAPSRTPLPLPRAADEGARPAGAHARAAEPATAVLAMPSGDDAPVRDIRKGSISVKTLAAEEKPPSRTPVIVLGVLGVVLVLALAAAFS